MADTFVCLLFTAAGIYFTIRGYMRYSEEEALPFMAVMGFPLIFEPLIYLIGWRTSGFLFQLLNTGLLAIMLIGTMINIFLAASCVKSEYRDSQREEFGAFVTILITYVCVIAELFFLPMILCQISGGDGAGLLRTTLDLIADKELIVALLGLFNETGRMLFGYVLIFIGVFILPAMAISAVLMLGWLIMDSKVGEFLGVGAMALQLLLTMIMPFAVMIYVVTVKLDAGLTTVEWTELPVLHVIAIFAGNLLGGAALSAMIWNDNDYRRDRFSIMLTCFLIYSGAHFVIVPLYVWLTRGLALVPASFSLVFGMLFKGGIWLLGALIASSILCFTGISDLFKIGGLAAAGASGSSKALGDLAAKAEKKYTVQDLPEKISDSSGREYWSYRHNTPAGSGYREYVCAKTRETIRITRVDRWENGFIYTKEGTFLDH